MSDVVHVGVVPDKVHRGIYSCNDSAVRRAEGLILWRRGPRAWQ